MKITSPHTIRLFTVLFMILVVSSICLAADSSQQDSYKIGVLAYKGKEDATKRWSAHGTYLNQQLAPLKFEIVPLTYKEDELTQAVIKRQVDFVITNPGHYIELELGGHVSRLATRRMSGPHGVLDQFGGTALTLPDRSDLNTYADLKGKSIFIPSQSSLGGWQVHLREAMAQGLDLRKDAHIVELKNHKKVVMAILAGEADAGFVRSDLVEELELKGLIRRDQLKVLNKTESANYPYLLSTRLYPEWPCATVNGTPSDIAVQVLRALLELSPENKAAVTAGIYGWTIPGNYSMVGDLFRETGLGPYTLHPPTIQDVIETYGLPLLILAVLISLVLLFSTLRTRRANIALRLEIIARKQEEDERKRLVTAITQAVESIVITDSDGLVQFVNPAFELTTGYSRQEVLGKNLRFLKSGEHDDAFYQEMWELITNGETWSGRIINKKKDGTLYTGEVSIAPVLDKSGSIVNFVAVKRDVTHEIHLEEQLHRAQKMEVIGLMAGGVAHDLNNILSGIVGYPELLLLDLPLDSELRQPIEAIHESGKRASAVVADLLTVARGAASIKENCDINSIIIEYLNSPEQKKLKSLYPQVRCQYQSTITAPIIFCSPVHVKKCLMNLITNATEAITSKGTVSVSIHHQIVADIGDTKLTLEPGDYIVLCVEDSGPGIPNQDLEHIFEPFYSKKVMGRSGTGLGLTIVWNTMQDHNGNILVESDEKGTCFQLYFPVCKSATIEKSRKFQEKDYHGNGEHILVIDDEKILRDIARQMLISLGYKVDTVASGEAAIAFVQKQAVDLLVIDMLMVPGINGRETYAEITQLYPDQKAIIASGFSKSDDVKSTLKLGATDFIQKPYSLERLAQAVKNTLIM